MLFFRNLITFDLYSRNSEVTACISLKILFRENLSLSFTLVI
jgi:hypothetical protein